MKIKLKYTLIFFALCGTLSVYAQSVAININGTAPDNSAMLDISSTEKGALIPRMTAAQRIAIVSPANGLMVFQTDLEFGLYSYFSSHSTWSRVTYDSTLSISRILELGNDAKGDTLINLDRLAIGSIVLPKSSVEIGNNLVIQGEPYTASNFRWFGSNIYVDGGDIKYLTTESAGMTIFGGDKTQIAHWESGIQDAIISPEPNSSIALNDNSIDLKVNSSLGTINLNSFTAIDSLRINEKFSFPSEDGTSGQILQTNGLGSLDWVSQSTGLWTESGVNIEFTTGKVGIGAAPTNVLSVYDGTVGAYIDAKGVGDAFNFSGLQLDSDESIDKSWAINHRKASAEINNLSFEYYNGFNFKQVFVLDSSGNTGIGVINPTNKLDVEGAAVFRSTTSISHPAVNHLSLTPFGSVSYIQSSIGGTPSSIEIQAEDFTIRTSTTSLVGGTERMTINSIGNVDIFQNLTVGGLFNTGSTATFGQNGTDGSLIIYSEQGAIDRTITIQPNAAMSQNVTLTLPSNDGISGQFLETDGNGNLTWTTPTSTADGDGIYDGGGSLSANTSISLGIRSLDINLNGIGDFTVQDNGTDKFQITDNGNSTFGGDVFWRDINTAGTLIASLADDGNDGIFTIYENGNASITLDANGTTVFNEQGLDRDFRIESTNNINILKVDAGSNRVGIGTSSPTETLDVEGNIHVTGEVRTDVNGAANMIPIAYGYVSTAGSLSGSSGNVSVSRVSSGQYNITISGETYTTNGFVTSATIVGSTYGFIHTDVDSGNLRVTTRNAGEAAVDIQFHFVIYRP